ncbi:PTS sugar transporter subunit IIA [Cytobacillus sp. FSL H8-0458]|uniref:PTS sugar transporter subunit IIA n=1 Tax=Cytobacillus sp. FSL H8-0458 TaxID=2975346 RepID=UPI0030F70CCB
MHQILITGHGGFPSGVVSALRFLLGNEPKLDILEFSEEMSHKQYETELINFLKKHHRIIIFADLTSSVPHQIIARVILENQYSPEHFLISGMSLSAITDLVMKFQFQEASLEEAPALIEQALSHSKDVMHYLSS